VFQVHKVVRAGVTGALAATAVAGGLALAGPAEGEPPAGGQFLPGESLAGVELGMTRAEVRATWGQRHGVCRECREETWYFNERPFHPDGAGVVFGGGRVAHAFTVWQPQGWLTPEGLELGDPAGEVGATYGELTERACSGYSALVLEDGEPASVFYVYEGELWGFGLVTQGRSPCL
jgi:hypothetical protein